MKSIIDSRYRNELINRIQKVEAGAPAKWGKMNAGEMICHVSDQIRMATGAKQTEFNGSVLTTTLLKWLALNVMPIPKGKIETVRELKQGEGGTKPTDHDSDKQGLIKLLGEFDRHFDGKRYVTHPVFGRLNYNQWGRMIYLHADHHLRQFGY